MYPSSVYFVPVIDISWEAFGPLNPAKNYSHTPPDLEQCADQCLRILALMKEFYGGKCAIAVHTGTYCRNGFHTEEFMKIWKSFEVGGGEILLHTHEEIAAVGTRNSDEDHMTHVITAQHAALKKNGINPAGYRGGLYGYASFLTPLLEKLHVHIDLSAAPGVERPDRAALWKEIPFSGFYLNRNNTSKPKASEQSAVFEIPLGASGMGDDNLDLLYVDYPKASLESLAGIWDVIIKRARNEGSQYIHTLFHSFSADIPVNVERYKRFIDYSYKNHGHALNASEMKRKYDEKEGVQ